MTSGDDLEALLARVALGDRAAFRRLYERTAPKLLGVALRILRDRAVAEDAVQEAYVKIWHAADSFRPHRGGAMNWLITVQRNKAIDMLRSARLLATRSAGIEEARDIADLTPEPHAAAETADDRRRLVSCLGALPPERSAAVRAAYVEGWSYEELARRHGVPLNTMRTWLRRALLRLKECLGA